MITVPEEMPFYNLNFALSKELTNSKESFTVFPFVSNEFNYINKGGNLWKAHIK